MCPSCTELKIINFVDTEVKSLILDTPYVVNTQLPTHYLLEGKLRRIRVLPRLKTKAERVGVVWAEFVSTSNIWDDTSKEN